MAGRSRVLVAYASKMGSTKEIAEVIGQELEAAGLHATVVSCAEDPSLNDFDGVIIGSAIYTRRWVKAATRYLKRHARELDSDSTWLFHSGPCGEGARDEQVPTPRAVTRVIGPRAAEGPLSGDFRDWTRIRAWASEIARQLDQMTAERQQ
jgi:menaquinone-dependent protoporphyrinogen oxidase